MPAGFTTAANNGTASAAGTSIAATVSAVANGSFIVGVCSWGSSNTADLLSVTDGTNTYTILQRIADTTNGQSAAVFYAWNIAGNPTTITANFNSVGWRGISVEVFSGVKTAADPINSTNFRGQLQTAPGTGTDGASSGSGNLTPTVDDCLIWAGSVNTGSNNASGTSEFAAGTGFTEPTGAEHQVNGDLSLSSEYAIQTTATAVNGTFTLTQNTSHITFMAVFEPPGGPTPPTLFRGSRMKFPSLAKPRRVLSGFGETNIKAWF